VVTLLAGQSENLSYLYLNGAKYHAMLSASPSTHAIMEKIGEGYRRRLQAIIEQGMTSGEFPPMESESVANALLGAYEGLMLLWVISPTESNLAENLRSAAHLLLSGLQHANNFPRSS